MTIPATNSNNSTNYNNHDFTLEPTHDRQTPMNADGSDVNNWKDLVTDFVKAALQTGVPVVGGPVAALGLLGAGQVADALGGGPAVPLTTPAASGNTGQMSDMERIQADGFKNSTYLIALQQEIQQENRQFTTVTNVIRAKHDTAKAALANIRS
jgi:hypothetical protein